MTRKRIPVQNRLPTRLKLGAAIRDARRAAGLTQQALGQLLRLKDRAVSRWEKEATAPRHRHRQAILWEINQLNPAAALQLQAVFTERTGKTYAVVPIPAAAQPTAVPASAPAGAGAQATSDVVEVALLKLADELDVVPHRARRALGRFLERLARANLAAGDVKAEIERLSARE